MPASNVDIVFENTQVSVDYDFQPAERKTRNYPGCEAEFDITGIFIEGENWIDYLKDSAISDIKESAISQIESEYGYQ